MWQIREVHTSKSNFEFSVLLMTTLTSGLEELNIKPPTCSNFWAKATPPPDDIADMGQHLYSAPNSANYDTLHVLTPSISDADPCLHWHHLVVVVLVSFLSKVCMFSLCVGWADLLSIGVNVSMNGCVCDDLALYPALHPVTAGISSNLPSSLCSISHIELKTATGVAPASSNADNLMIGVVGCLCSEGRLYVRKPFFIIGAVMMQ